MPFRHGYFCWAPTTHEHWRHKKHSGYPSIADVIIKKWKKGESIPIIDKETFKQFQEQRASTSKTSRQQASPASVESKTYPEPKFTINESYSIRDMPFKPKNYIRYIEPSAEEADARVEYDMDEEDLAWLESANQVRLENGLDEVSLDDFELLMDRFEKECYFQIKNDGNEKGTLEIRDEEAICCICADGDCQTANEILFCDMCNLAVHQECYGIPYIPEGQWLCRRCVYSPSKTVKCILCPSNSGAFKMALNGNWAHILCAIWIPEVQFANPVFLEPIDSVQKITSTRWKLSCQLCKQKGIGACIQCMQKKCNMSFHPTCGQQAGFYMKFIGKPGDPNTKSNRIVFCSDHIPQNIKTKFDELHKLRTKMLKSVKSPVVFEPVVPPERIQDISHLVDFKKKNIFILRLLAYWSLKRRSRYGVPLLPKHYAIHTSDYVPPAVKPPNDSDYKYWLRFRQDLERVRLLLELVRKREKLKCELTKIKEKCIEFQLLPIVPYLRKLVKTLMLLDEDDIFEKPVDLNEVPTYLDVIKHPMDFSTMISKIDKYCYTSLEEFESDFNLMINNCLRFNDKNSFYYKAGLELRHKSKPIFKKARQDLQLQGQDFLNLNQAVQIKKELIEESREMNCFSDEQNVSSLRNRSLKRKLSSSSSTDDPDENRESEVIVKTEKDQNRNMLLTDGTLSALNATIKTEPGLDSFTTDNGASYSKRLRTTPLRNEGQYSL